jgi:hypothetical protein
MRVNGILLAQVRQKSLEGLKQLAFKGPFVACTLQEPLRQLLEEL